MNAYDFDDTIYDGESIVDFFLFCLKKDIKLIRFFPKIIYKLIKYKFNKLSIEELSETANNIISKIIDKYDYNALVSEFWEKNNHKLKKEFLDMLKEDDLIITGCPNFLLDYIKEKLKAKNILCTNFSLKDKKIKYICFGKNKVDLFNKYYKGKKINKFYTDSLADKPFMKISNEVYLVKKNKITKVDKNLYI